MRLGLVGRGEEDSGGAGGGAHEACCIYHGGTGTLGMDGQRWFGALPVC